MALSVVEQIAALERERVRLEGHLTADDNWRQLQSLTDLNGASPPDGVESEKRLRRKLAANPYYSARLKIVEAITILRRLGESTPASGANGTDESAAAATWHRLAVPLFDQDREPGPERWSAPLPHADAKASEQPVADAPSPESVLVATEESAPQSTGTGDAPAAKSDEPAAVPESAAATAASEASMQSQPAQTDAASGGEPVPALPEPIDDLTRIRGLTAVDAAGLAGIGIVSFEQIAGLNADAVRETAKQLGLGKRIAKANWIEQAAVLAKEPKGAEAEAARAKIAAEAVSQPQSAASIAAATIAEPPAPAEEPTAAESPATIAQPQMPAFQSLPTVAGPAPTAAPETGRIGAARERYTPLFQLNEVQRHPVAQQTVPPPPPPPQQQAPPVATEPAIKPSPRDWLAQRRRETAVAAARPETAPEPVQSAPAPAATPPPIPVAAQTPPTVHATRISISTPEMPSPQEAEEIIASGASEPEGRKLLVAGAGAIKSLRDRLLGSSVPSRSESDPSSVYRNEEAEIEIVGGHVPSPHYPTGYDAGGQPEQAPADTATAKSGNRLLSQVFGALKKRG